MSIDPRLPKYARTHALLNHARSHEHYRGWFILNNPLETGWLYFAQGYRGGTDPRIGTAEFLHEARAAIDAMAGPTPEQYALAQARSRLVQIAEQSSDPTVQGMADQAAKEIGEVLRPAGRAGEGAA